MKAILIDSVNEVIREVNIPESSVTNYEQMDEMHRLIDCHLFTTAGQLKNQDCLYVDDEGMFTKETYILVDWYPQPLWGNGLLMGTTNEGDSKDVVSSVEEITKRVKFLSYDELLEWSNLFG